MIAKTNKQYKYFTTFLFPLKKYNNKSSYYESVEWLDGCMIAGGREEGKC